MFQTATNPFPQPTARSPGDSQVTQLETVDGGLASNAGDCTLTIFNALADIV